MITYKKVLETGFDFGEIDLSDISKDLDNLTFYINEDKKIGTEVSWSTYGMPDHLNTILKLKLSNICDNYINSVIKNIKTFEAYKSNIGDYVDFHSDSSFGGLIQVMVYYIKDTLKGREFLYGTQSNYKSIKPYTGLVIICDQINPEWIHGTNPLLNNCYNLCITAIK